MITVYRDDAGRAWVAADEALAAMRERDDLCKLVTELHDTASIIADGALFMRARDVALAASGGRS